MYNDAIVLSANTAVLYLCMLQLGCRSIVRATCTSHVQHTHVAQTYTATSSVATGLWWCYCGGCMYPPDYRWLEDPSIVGAGRCRTWWLLSPQHKTSCRLRAKALFCFHVLRPVLLYMDGTRNVGFRRVIEYHIRL